MNQTMRSNLDKFSKRSIFDKLNRESSRPISAICKDWEDNWLKTRETLGENNPIVHKGLALRCLINMIVRHFKSKEAIDPYATAAYLKDVVFSEQPPESVTRGTLITEEQYYELLMQLYNEIEGEIRGA